MAYIAKNGCVYRTFESGQPNLVVAKFAPNGFKAREFADPEADRLARLACAAMNASESVSA